MPPRAGVGGWVGAKTAISAPERPLSQARLRCAIDYRAHKRAEGRASSREAVRLFWFEHSDSNTVGPLVRGERYPVPGYPV